MSNQNYLTTIAEPNASAMIETFRAIGYSLETAIADLVDNSIAAQANNIEINYEWNGENSIIKVTDDGVGMDSKQIIEAMRPGSRNPLEERSIKDLGRFGLGLKTASFSQTRKFSVISKRIDTKAAYWAWDLDYVKQSQSWELIQYCPDENLKNNYNDIDSGTTVIWYCLDRNLKNVKENDEHALSKFMELMEGVKRHLEMVFHRFLEQGKLKIIFQGREIKSWDPFLRGVDGSQSEAEEFIDNGSISIKGYVLPHKSKLSNNDFLRASGPKGWNDQQGFYIYRNERLLVPGNWLGMYKNEEHYKLCRIMIDLPNTVYNDNLWQIDIKKSIARPPLKIQRQLKAYAQNIRNKAVKVYRHKGKVIQRKFESFKFQPIWVEKKRHNKRFYSINRNHPIIEEILKEPNKNNVNELLRFVEETVPVPLISIRESENPETTGYPFENLDNELLFIKMKKCFEKLVDSCNSKEEAVSSLLNIEPFDNYPQYIDQILEEV